MSEFNLSDKIGYGNDIIEPPNFLSIQAVKEFIKLLKEELDKPDLQFKNNCEECQRNLVILSKGDTFVSSTIDKLAGDKLI